MTTTFYIDHFRTTNPLNGSQGHWRQRAREAKRERQFVYEWLTCMLKGYPGPNFQGTILLTRVAARCMDPDGLAASFKRTQDAIGDYLTGAPCGKGRDALPGVIWVYAQRRGGVKEYGVEVTFTEADDAPLRTYCGDSTCDGTCAVCEEGLADEHAAEEWDAGRVWLPDALAYCHPDEMPTARVMRRRETAGEEGLGW